MAKTKRNIAIYIPEEIIINRIHILRGHKVMLDFDLAILYEVETRRLNEQVKRNSGRFPKDFMFRLTSKEWKNMMSQNATSSQIKRKTAALPYAFTEQGVAMLSGVINSQKAIDMNIAIMRAFVEMRKLAHSSKKIATEIKKLIDKVGEHDIQLAGIYDAIEDLLDKKVEEKNWSDREPIGFKQKR
jgi:hypothetical protein